MVQQILAVEPYYGGSHQAWLDGLIARSSHQFTRLTLPAHKWKWRMRSAAPVLAREFDASLKKQPFDLLLASDMLDLATFIALTRPAFCRAPSILYMHENQFNYPRHEQERLDYQFALTNWLSIEAADCVVFNSPFHKRDFFSGLRALLDKMPDPQPRWQPIKTLEAKSRVIAPGIDLQSLNTARPCSYGPPVILWNHRWDRDKQPEVFIDALNQLRQKGIAFQVIICGESFRRIPEAFEQAPAILGERLIHFGYAPTRRDYAELLAQSDILVSTARQEFFGISVIEAVYAGAFPILPNRLNYPHLIPPQYHSAALYEEGELTDKLEDTLQRAQRRELPRLSEPMKQYDWGQVIHDYERLFDDLYQKKDENFYAG